jgi:hypothetical protein
VQRKKLWGDGWFQVPARPANQLIEMVFPAVVGRLTENRSLAKTAISANGSTLPDTP